MTCGRSLKIDAYDDYVKLVTMSAIHWSFFQSRTSNLEYLTLAYDVSQRVAIALEVVLRGLQSSPELYVERKGNFWSLAYQACNRLIEAIYLRLLSQNINLTVTVNRSIVNPRLACVTSRAYQDLRDYLILRDSSNIAEILLRVLNE